MKEGNREGMAKREKQEQSIGLCVAEEGLWGGGGVRPETLSCRVLQRETRLPLDGILRRRIGRWVGGCIAEWPVEEEAIDRRKRPNGRLWSGA